MDVPQRRIEFGWPGDGGVGDGLVQEIIDGAKTATCGFKSLYDEAELAEVYEGVGELHGASSCGGPVRCVIRVTEAFETTFGDPDPRLVRGEGDGEDVRKFQADHRIAWEAERPGGPPGDDEALVVELFELVAVLGAGDDAPLRLGLHDIVTRPMPPEPWAEGENLPWDEPGFSGRMLTEHLSQEHDLASRRLELVDRHVTWIHRELLAGRPARVLDLACGPGLYTSRLARLGHTCVGIDFAPAAVGHARDEAAHERLDCTYRLEDVREADFGRRYGLIMMLWGQLNVFRRAEARTIVERAVAALEPGGLLLLEPQRFATVEESGRAPSTWYSCGEQGGLFSSRSHLCLGEGHWDDERRSTTQRFYVVDAQTGDVSRYAMTSEAYTEDELVSMLEEAGLRDVKLLPSLQGNSGTREGGDEARAGGGEASEGGDEVVSPTLVVIGRR